MKVLSTNKREMKIYDGHKRVDLFLRITAEWKTIFTKPNTPRDIKGTIKTSTFVPFVFVTISQKGAKDGSKIKFMIIVPVYT